MSVTMYDTIIPSTVPANPAAVAGYVGGSWPDYPALVSLFPHAKHLSIAPFASLDADCLDIEPLDATNAQAGAWFRRQHKPKDASRSVLYTSASNVDGLNRSMFGSGVARDKYLIWSAHFTFREHICGPATCGYPQADLTQWTDLADGRNLDQSICSDLVFGVVTPPPPIDPHHYDRFEDVDFMINGRAINERHTAQEYDRLRNQPYWKIIAHRPRLHVLRGDCTLLAGRILRVAGDLPKSQMLVFHRRWRVDQLHKRAHGDRV